MSGSRGSIIGNRRRRHSVLGFLSPAAFEDRWAEAQVASQQAVSESGVTSLTAADDTRAAANQVLDEGEIKQALVSLVCEQRHSFELGRYGGVT